MKSSTSKQQRKTVKTRSKTKLRKRTTYRRDRDILIAKRAIHPSVPRPLATPKKPNRVHKKHIAVAMSHGMELALANGQSAPFVGAESWGSPGLFMAKRDLRTKLKMCNIFYAPGYSTTPTTAQGGGYGFYRGRFHCLGNNLTNPIPGTTHRPFGFNELSEFFTYYEVHSCRIRLHVQNLSYGGTRAVAAPPGSAFAAVFPISYAYSDIAGTNPGSPANTGSASDNTLSSNFWARENLVLQPHVTTEVMTHPEGGKPWAILEQHWTTSEILGTVTDDEWNFKGATKPVNDTDLTPPTNVWNYVVGLTSIPRSGAGGGGSSGAAAFGQPSYLAMSVQVELEYDVTFFDARLIEPSEAPTYRSTSPEVIYVDSDDEKEDEPELPGAPNPFAL